MTAARHKHDAQIDRVAWAKSLILFGMGIYLALLMLTGNLDNYINLRFAWLVLVGALLFVLLGLVNLYSCLHPQAKEHSHQHYQISWDIILVVAFPLLLAILIPSRALGHRGGQRRRELEPGRHLKRDAQPARPQYPGLAARI